MTLQLDHLSFPGYGRACPERIEVQFVGRVAIGGKGGDRSAASARSVEPLVAGRAATSVAALPVRQAPQARGVIRVYDHRVSGACRDDEVPIVADQRPARLHRDRILLILLHDVGGSPRFGFDRIVPARDC